MKFQFFINMERLDAGEDMREIMRHTLDLVQMADRGGFDIVWAGEHHALEMTIAPDPFQLLTWWAEHTDRIRLGTAVVTAAYWHPVKLAGVAAMTDLISGGRLELGLGSGAYQREFDRMLPGVKQTDGWRYLQEMLPVLKALWEGDYAHDGEFWSFPATTSVPKPQQQPHPPFWVAARAPVTYDFAVQNGCNILSWPLTRSMAEAELYKARLEQALADNPPCQRPVFAMMRHTAVYEHKHEWEVPVRAVQRNLAQFENLFKNLGDVNEGFPIEIDLGDLEHREEFEPAMLHQNLMFGTPDEIIAKLQPYAALGVDCFTYYASLGLAHKEQRRSLELFIEEVMPAFR